MAWRHALVPATGSEPPSFGSNPVLPVSGVALITTLRVFVVSRRRRR